VAGGLAESTVVYRGLVAEGHARHDLPLMDAGAQKFV